MTSEEKEAVAAYRKAVHEQEVRKGRWLCLWLPLYFVGMFLIAYILETHGIHVCQGLDDPLCH